MPPLMTVGSTPPASSNAAIMLVVVVLPCVPATATVDFRRISSASISARRTTGMRALQRRVDFRIGTHDRGGRHDHRRIAEVRRGMADRDGDAFVAQALRRHSLRPRPTPARDSRGSSSPPRCRTCRCRRCRRSGSCRCRLRLPSASKRRSRKRLAAGRRGCRDGQPRERGAQALDQIGEVARRMRPTDRSRPRRRIRERAGIEAQLLHLLGELDGREILLVDRPRAAGPGDLLGVGGLVIVGRARVSAPGSPAVRRR